MITLVGLEVVEEHGAGSVVKRCGICRPGSVRYYGKTTDAADISTKKHIKFAGGGVKPVEFSCVCSEIKRLAVRTPHKSAGISALEVGQASGRIEIVVRSSIYLIFTTFVRKPCDGASIRTP